MKLPCTGSKCGQSGRKWAFTPKVMGKGGCPPLRIMLRWQVAWGGGNSSSPPNSDFSVCCLKEYNIFKGKAQVKNQNREQLWWVLSNARAAGQHRGGKEPGKVMVSNRHISHWCGHVLGDLPRGACPCPGVLVPALRVGSGTIACLSQVVFPGDAPLEAHPSWSPHQ